MRCVMCIWCIILYCIEEQTYIALKQMHISFRPSNTDVCDYAWPVTNISTQVIIYHDIPLKTMRYQHLLWSALIQLITHIWISERFSTITERINAKEALIDIERKIAVLKCVVFICYAFFTFAHPEWVQAICLQYFLVSAAFLKLFASSWWYSIYSFCFSSDVILLTCSNKLIIVGLWVVR